MPQTDVDSPEFVDHKVKALLNKLTIEKFDSISNQIIAWVNKSEMEEDRRTLIQVTRLIIEAAACGPVWSETYARLCCKMMEQISPKVQDDSIKDADGKPIAGAQLFRKHLLNRCQDLFKLGSRGWFAKEAGAKANHHETIKAVNEKKGTYGEAKFYSNEYYFAQKARRQSLGLIKFIGELFKVRILTERITHECVKKLLGNVEYPEDEQIEGLCQLLTTAGQILDNPKARAHMDVYFTRMKELRKSPNVSPRVRLTLQDIIELRERNWVSPKEMAAPTSITASHEIAVKEYRRQSSLSHGGSWRGGDRNQELGPDGWAVAGSVPRPPPKAGDLSNFGKINKATPMTFGPSSVFAGKKNAAASKRESLSRTSSRLSQNPELAAEASGKPSRSGSRKSSVDFGQTGLPEAPPTRRKLQLLPRSKPTEESTPAASKDKPDSAADASAVPTAMSEADAKKRVDEDVKEFFAVRNLEEADVYFTNLTPEHRLRLISKLVGFALESKEADARLVGDFFSQVVGKSQVDADTFEKGFMPMASLLDEIAIDALKALEYMAIMLRGAGIDKDEERLGRITAMSMNRDKLWQLVKSS
ncbi:ARM repeat-containing protein [Leucogyrophana mollusca]|uniref:ARM repeat-containing protein n=1 Tax=Leucogyrophana mollusca TaxID=85980 RepID=A0ACB8B1I2_9AGAM|nr:ARM repeat-containing protein [Leucogyrophana mollusca]